MGLMYLLILTIGHFNQLVQPVSSLEGTHNPPMKWFLHELSGTHLRLSISADPPFITEQQDSDGNVTYDGYIVEMADYMAKAFNVTYSFVPVKEVDVRELGARVASVKLLLSKEVDVNTNPMILGLRFCTLVDCSLPLFFETTKLMVPWPKEETPIVAPIRPFQYQVWIWLPISIFLVALALVLLQNYLTKRRSKGVISNKTASANIWKILMYIVVGEGDWNQWNQLSFRLVQGAWCLAAVVLFNAYCSILISYLISPRLMPVAKSYQDVASGTPQKLKLLAEKNTLLPLYSLQATSGPFKGLGDLLRRYPESIFTEREKGFEQMFTGQYAYIEVGERVGVFMAKAFTKTEGRCHFTISNENMDNKMYPVVWSFSNKWRYIDAFNNKMNWLSGESGVLNYLMKRSTPHVDSCSLENHKALTNGENESRKVLSLSHLSGPFILLIFGLSLSLLVFLMEKVYYNFKFHHSRRTIITI